MEIAISQQSPFLFTIARPMLLDEVEKRELLKTSSTYTTDILSKRVGKAKYKRRNTNINKRRYKVQNAKYKMQSVKYKMLNAK